MGQWFIRSMFYQMVLTHKWMGHCIQTLETGVSSDGIFAGPALGQFFFLFFYLFIQTSWSVFSMYAFFSSLFAGFVLQYLSFFRQFSAARVPTARPTSRWTPTRGTPGAPHSGAGRWTTWTSPGLLKQWIFFWQKKWMTKSMKQWTFFLCWLELQLQLKKIPKNNIDLWAMNSNDDPMTFWNHLETTRVFCCKTFYWNGFWPEEMEDGDEKGQTVDTGEDPLANQFGSCLFHFVSWFDFEPGIFSVFPSRFQQSGRFKPLLWLWDLRFRLFFCHATFFQGRKVSGRGHLDTGAAFLAEVSWTTWAETF